MIKKLRIKFIVITMVVVVVVLFSIIGAINIHNYVETKNDADEMLTLLAKNDGKFPREEMDRDIGTGEITGDERQEDSDKQQPPFQIDAGKNMTEETPYETRYFAVIVYDDGTSTVNVDQIAAVDESKALQYVSAISSSEKTSGYQDNYRYLISSEDGKTTYVFLDCTNKLNTCNEFLKASMLISVAGLAVVLVLVILFSGIVFKPVAETYKKQKRFITDANHELKTPLTVIDASCEVLELSDGENEWTATIKEQVAKLTELTNKLVFLSRMDEEDRKNVMTDFSLSEVVEEELKPYFTLAQNADKHLDSNIMPNISLCGDIALIKQLCTLLFDNAIKYSSANGSINVELTQSGKSKKLVVSNDTDGVPVGNLDILFERFYRLDSSRNSETGGSGIGLSVAKAIVEQHKGKISATSPDGQKIIFTISF